MTKKTLDQQFRDWETHVFGFGYGTGEMHILPALRTFFETVNPRQEGQYSGYDYRKLEEKLGPTVTWLLINNLCHAGLINYGGSARFGWIEKEGEALRDYILSKTDEELYDIAASIPEEWVHNCFPDNCQCDEHCDNPFWVSRQRS